MKSLGKEVIKRLATNLPQLLKLEKYRQDCSTRNLATILRALPTLVQIIFYARKEDMPIAKEELELLIESRS